MILHAGSGLVLTQSADIPMKERVFRTHVNLRSASEIEQWKEITEKQKDEMLAETAIIDVNDMTIESIDNVTVLLNDIAENINTVPMTEEEALERKGYFPKWENEIGKLLPVGFRMQHVDKLYETIQEHTASEEWVPGVGTESLYKVVQVEATGTIDDPIAYDGNMELFNGLYYVQDGVLYLCIRDSGTPLYHALKDLVGIYVEVVEQ